MNYKIPDFSFWQDDPTTPQGIDFTQTRKQTRGVILRAGQGSWKDNEFDISWANAKAAGLLRGSYWFYDSRVNPKRQAEKYVEVLGSDRGEMEMWCDFEDRYGGDFGHYRDWYDFMEQLKILAPEKQLGVYTGYYYFNEFAFGVNYFGKYPLWIAWYNPNKPLIPHIWKDWTYGQYTDDYDGAGWGAESHEIDMNYFNGTEAEFMARYGAVESPKARLTARFGDTIAEYQEKQ